MEERYWKWDVQMMNMAILITLGMMVAGSMAGSALWALVGWREGMVFTEDGVVTWMMVLFGLIPVGFYHRHQGWRIKAYGRGVGMPWGPFVGALLVVLAVNELAELFIDSWSVRLEDLGLSVSDPWMEEVEGPFSMLLFLYTVVLAPVFEEIVYRGMIVRTLAPRSKVMAVIVSGVCFGLMHGNIPQIVFTTVMGFFLAYVMLETGSLVAPVLLHMANNLYAELFNEVILVRWGDRVDVWTVYQGVAPLVAFILLLVGLVTVTVYFHGKRQSHATQNGSSNEAAAGIWTDGMSALPEAPFHTKGAFVDYFLQPSTYLLLAFFIWDIYGGLS